MKQIFILLFVLLSVGSAFGQVTGSEMPAPVPFYGPSTSVIDRAGNLLIFDVNYNFPAPLPGTRRVLARIPTVKTQLTVVRSNGRKDAPKEFDGTVQVLGAGYYAVYIVLTSNASNTTRRQLVAINLDSSAQPAPVTVPLRADASFSASGDAQHLDVISFVDPPANPRILAAARTAPAVQRFARLITCDGRAFSSTDPIPLP